MSPAQSADLGMIAKTTAQPWSFVRRLAFRFVFVYLVLYNFPGTLIYDIPPVERAFDGLDHKLVLWFAGRVLPLRGPITVFPNGSGDTTYNYVQILLYAVFALGAACVWSAIERRSTRHETLHEALRIYVRFVLGLILFDYGMVKVLKSQFPQPDFDVLLEPYGKSSPMRLL